MKKLLRRLPWVILILGLAAALTWGFWPVPAMVDVAKATKGTLIVTVNDDGKTRIREKYVISAPVTGKLLRLSLKAGDEVTNGSTVLAVIEPSDPSLLDPRATAEAEARVSVASAALDQSQTAVNKAIETHKHAKTEYDRAEKAFGRGAMTDADFETVRHQERMAAADLRSAEFGLKVAKFELELAKTALIRTRPLKKSDKPESITMTIQAPVSGRVLRVFQESASVVTPGTKLLELGDPSDLELEIDVLSTDAVPIKPGAKVLIEHWGGEEALKGVVRLIEPSAFLKISALGVEEQRVNVIADFADSVSLRKTLGDGYRIEARIVIDERKNVVKVPSGVLFREGDDWYAFRIVNGTAQKQKVKLGKSNGTEAEILEGIAEGDDLILHPTDKIKDGIAVQRN